jgi:hypothetical protein
LGAQAARNPAQSPSSNQRNAVWLASESCPQARAERNVWPDHVVIVLPCSQDNAGLGERGELLEEFAGLRSGLVERIAMKSGIMKHSVAIDGREIEHQPRA